MSNSLGQVAKAVLVICGAAILAGGLLVNGFFMLISPRRWYRLPRWLPATGSLQESMYSAGWGAVQVRLVGATFIGVTAWVLYAVLTRR